MISSPAPAFQFPPLREGRLVQVLFHGFTRGISIPAPARGATFPGKRLGRAWGISIPAPARGATRSSTASARWPAYFNSRPCARGDGGVWSVRYWLGNISIPAPARGATSTSWERSSARSTFQFPPLREGRRMYARGLNSVIYFNSRPCARGDGLAGGRKEKMDTISIPAPARGATIFKGDNRSAIKFQFPPLREGRRAAAVRLLPEIKISIPAPARGATHGLGADRRRNWHFNSRPCARGDKSEASSKISNVNFNSRPCARGDG